MPTTSGWLVGLTAACTIGVGRFFGILELFVVGTGLATSLVWAIIIVRFRAPTLGVTRTIRPDRPTAGEPARAELEFVNTGRTRSAPVRVIETVGRSSSARMRIGALVAGDRIAAGYRIPTSRRGRLPIGPTVLVRQDALGLASRAVTAIDVVDVVVAPRTVELAMPVLGRGPLGRELAATARRLGPGEFHALRTYAPGDDPRLVDWKASARTDDLVVREHRTPELQRCVVVLDRSGDTEHVHDSSDPFELAVIAAASIVLASDRAGLATIFRTGGGVDLRGSDVAARTLEVLATLEAGSDSDDGASDPPLDGLGLLVVITNSPESPAWSTTSTDPTTARIGVFTRSMRTDSTRSGSLIPAPTLDAFVTNWADLVDDHGSRTARSR